MSFIYKSEWESTFMRTLMTRGVSMKMAREKLEELRSYGIDYNEAPEKTALPILAELDRQED